MNIYESNPRSAGNHAENLAVFHFEIYQGLGPHIDIMTSPTATHAHVFFSMSLSEQGGPVAGGIMRKVPSKAAKRHDVSTRIQVIQGRRSK
jgi:hypothetical protein